MLDEEIALRDRVSNRGPCQELLDTFHTLVHQGDQRGEFLSQLGVGRCGLCGAIGMRRENDDLHPIEHRELEHVLLGRREDGARRAHDVVVVTGVAHELAHVDSPVHTGEDRHHGMPRGAGKEATHAASELVLELELLPDLLGRDRLVVYEIEAAEPVLQANPEVDQATPKHELSPRVQNHEQDEGEEDNPNPRERCFCFRHRGGDYTGSGAIPFNCEPRRRRPPGSPKTSVPHW